MPRLSDIHKLSVKERQNLLKQKTGLSDAEADVLFGEHGLDLDAIGETVVGTIRVPLFYIHDMLINGREYQLCIATEEKSVPAGLNYAAKIAHESGGVKSKALESNVLGHFLLYDVPDWRRAKAAIDGDAERLLGIANKEQKHSHAYKLKVNHYDEMREDLEVELWFTSGDAMGAVKASQMTEAIAEEAARLARGRIFGRVVSNATGRRVRAELEMPVDILGRDGFSGEEIAYGIEKGSRWAHVVKNRAVTANKGAMNGMEALGLATAQDTRAMGASFYSNSFEEDFAASEWKIRGNKLHGLLDAVLPVGIAGGEIRHYPKARLILDRVLNVRSADELAEVTAATGLLQHYAAMSMLAGPGVTKGHGVHR